MFLGRTERHLIEVSSSESTETKALRRGRGRPRLFDRTAAIQQAMVLFWDRGYEGTTFDDLIGAMKLSPSSFYHEFGSKEQLYREAVDYYLKLSTDYAKSPRAPEGMLRLGQSLAMLGNNEQACATFGEVGRRFPTATSGVKKTIEREMQKDHC